MWYNGAAGRVGLEGAGKQKIDRNNNNNNNNNNKSNNEAPPNPEREALEMVRELLLAVVGKRSGGDMLSILADPSVLFRVQAAHQSLHREQLKTFQPICVPHAMARGEGKEVNDITGAGFLPRAALAALIARAAYSALTLRGAGDSGQSVLRTVAWKTAIGGFSDEQHLNAFLELAGAQKADVVLASWQENTFEPAFVIFRVRSVRWLVIAVRGTTEWTSVLTDVAAQTCELAGGYAHAGMVRAARWVWSRCQEVVITELGRAPHYSLVCVGHSMGGNVAALLALMLRRGELELEISMPKPEPLPGLQDFLGGAVPTLPLPQPPAAKPAVLQAEATQPEESRREESQEQHVEKTCVEPLAGLLAVEVLPAVPRAAAPPAPPPVVLTRTSLCAPTEHPLHRASPKRPEVQLRRSVSLGSNMRKPEFGSEGPLFFPEPGGECSSSHPSSATASGQGFNSGSDSGSGSGSGSGSAADSAAPPLPKDTLKRAVAYTFGASPHMSEDLAASCRPFVLSIGRNIDWITRLSVLNVDMLLLELTECSAHTKVKQWVQERLGKRRPQPSAQPCVPADQPKPEATFQPGRLLHADRPAPNRVHLHWTTPGFYQQLRIGPSMFHDHLPIRYVEDLLIAIRETRPWYENDLQLAGRTALDPEAQARVRRSLERLLAGKERQPAPTRPFRPRARSQTT